jgi:hypothetical protein
MSSPYREQESDIGITYRFHEKDIHGSPGNDDDDNSDTTALPDSEGFLDNRTSRGRRSKKTVLKRTLWNFCTAWLLMLMTQICIFVILCLRLPVREIHHLNGDIYGIVPECK